MQSSAPQLLVNINTVGGSEIRGLNVYVDL